MGNILNREQENPKVTAQEEFYCTMRKFYFSAKSFSTRLFSQNFNQLKTFVQSR